MTSRQSTAFILIAAVAVGGAGFSYDMLLPVGSKQTRNAIVLSKVGPRSAAAYQDAVADDVITRKDMRQLRWAAGQDIDADKNLDGSPS